MGVTRDCSQSHLLHPILQLVAEWICMFFVPFEVDRDGLPSANPISRPVDCSHDEARARSA